MASFMLKMAFHRWIVVRNVNRGSLYGSKYANAADRSSEKFEYVGVCVFTFGESYKMEEFGGKTMHELFVYFRS